MAVKHQKHRVTTAPQVVARASFPDVAAFLERHARALAFALVILATVRIVATYTVFNHTFDEPAHIACGTEWLADHVYKWEDQHPPLSRVAVSLGPYLMGARPQGTPRINIYAMSHEGVDILYAGHHYDLWLALARLGNLPFFWVACLVIYQWGKRFGTAVGVASLFVFSFLPPVLAHAALATTDMALTAFLGAAFLTGLIWIEKPSITHAVWFGIAMALAFLSKFSTLVYFPAAAVFVFAWYYFARRPKLEVLIAASRERLPSLGLAVLIALPIIWAMYRFSFGTPLGANFRMPAPEIYNGIQEVLKHNREGHHGYLLGQLSKNGFLMFYPVALLVKTPLAVLLLFGIGVVQLFKKRELFHNGWIALCFSAGIMVPALASHINIGIRHILPIYFGIALISAAALLWLLDPARTIKWQWRGASLLAAWLAVSSLVSHPDYLPYFNELAGGHPEDILVDSDLDWGQDTKRLAKRLQEVDAKEVTFGTLLIADLEKEHGFPPNQKEMDVMNPSPGWNAVSMTNWKEYRFGLVDKLPEYKVWPERYPPLERVGKSILLYYFDPASMPRQP